MISFCLGKSNKILVLSALGGQNMKQDYGFARRLAWILWIIADGPYRFVILLFWAKAVPFPQFIALSKKI